MAAAGEHLYRQEALNSLMAGIVERLLVEPNAYGPDAPYMGVVFANSEPVLAGTMTPPYGLLLARLAEESEAAEAGIPPLAADLIDHGWPLPDVQGAKPLSQQFAQAWARLTGGQCALAMAQRLYVLTQVDAPAGVPGSPRLAEPEHADLIAGWMQAFEVEALGNSPRPQDKLLAVVEKRIAAGDWQLWQDGGQIVSVCVKERPTRTGCAVGGVYTPPEHRRQGYAGACVAALSQRLLDQGFAFTSLFTDLANPTSNSVYLKIGYRPLADFDKYRLMPASQA